MHTVLKPFNTVSRRFKPGDAVTEADVEDFARWQDRGFISGGKPPVVIATEAPAALVETAREERKKR